MHTCEHVLQERCLQDQKGREAADVEAGQLRQDKQQLQNRLHGLENRCHAAEERTAGLEARLQEASDACKVHIELFCNSPAVLHSVIWP